MSINLEHLLPIDRTIIKHLNDLSGYLIGGAIRDFLRGDCPNDLDLKFPHSTKHEPNLDPVIFYNRICKDPSLVITLVGIKSSYNTDYMKNPDTLTRANILLCLQKISLCVTFSVQLITSGDTRLIDISHCVYENIYRNLDFDVNCLKLGPFVEFDQTEMTPIIDPIHQTYLNQRLVHDLVIQHIHDKQLVVLDVVGNPVIEHDPNSMIHQIYEEYEKYDPMCCIILPKEGVIINRDTYKAVKLMTRMQKMHSRGWTILNKRCVHTCCVLSTIDTLAITK